MRPTTGQIGRSRTWARSMFPWTQAFLPLSHPVILEKPPEHFIRVHLATHAADEPLAEIRFAAWPRVTTTANLVQAHLSGVRTSREMLEDARAVAFHRVDGRIVVRVGAAVEFHPLVHRRFCRKSLAARRQKNLDRPALPRHERIFRAVDDGDSDRPRRLA